MITRHRRRNRAVGALLLLTLLVASCGTSEENEDSTAPAPEGPEPREVTLVTHDSFALTPALLEAFTEETGITVNILAGGDAGTALNRAILTAGTPEGDVLFGVDSNLLGRALDAELFVAYESDLLENVPEELRAGPEVTPIDVGDVCLNYDREWFAQEELAPPEELDDLIDPAYEGLTVVLDPATSSPGLAFVLATVAEYGDDGWEQWWEALRDNDVQVESGWTSGYNGAFSGGSAEGDRPIVVSYASSPAAEVFYGDGLTEAPTAVVTSSCYRQVEYAGILAGTTKQDEAEALIDFLLSPEVQADIPTQMWVYPVRTDVELPDVFTEHATAIESPLALPPLKVDELREEIIATWRELVLR